MKTSSTQLLLIALFIALSACGDDSRGGTGSDAGVASPDAGLAGDGGRGGGGPDASELDAGGFGEDAGGMEDAGHPDGGDLDAAMAIDGGVDDGGMSADAGADAGPDPCGTTPPRGPDSTRPLSFAAADTLATSACHARFGDVDGDLDADVIVAGCDGSITWRERTASTYAAAVPLAGFTASGSRAQGMWTGDFDGDGHLDIAVADSLVDLRVLFGDGLGGVAASVTLDGSSTSPLIAYGSVRLVAELDADPQAELLLSDRTLHGSAARVFSEVLHSASGVPEHHRWLTGEIDRLDDDLDLLAVNSTEGILLRNRGDATFADAGTAPVTHVEAYYARLVDAWLTDMDGDCRGDLVKINSTFTPQDRLCAFAAPAFTRELLLPTTSTSTVACVDVGSVLGQAMADLDADGDLDLVISNYGLDVYRATGGRLVIDYALTFPGPEDGRLEVADVEGDGDADILIAVSRTGWSRDYYFVANTTPAP